MDLGIQGRVALVAAGSKGLGKAIAMGLAREGCQVLIFSRDAEGVGRAVADIRATTGAEVDGMAADVTEPAALQSVVDRTHARFGPISILVNNAGGPRPGTFDDVADEDWVRAFELNLMSAVRLTRLVLPDMRAQQWGRIVNVTSQSVKQPIPNLMLSNAVRSGTVAMASTLAKAVAREGITVNNLAPGRFATERVEELDQDTARRQGITVQQVRANLEVQVPAGRYGRPEEFAAAAVFLASEAASYITGVTLLVDGGNFRGTY